MIRQNPVVATEGDFCFKISSIDTTQVSDVNTIDPVHALEHERFLTLILYLELRVQVFPPPFQVKPILNN